MELLQRPLFIGPNDFVYRAYSRKLDEDGRVQHRDFLLRVNEKNLSVALVGEKSLDELDVRGYVPLRIGLITDLGLSIIPKEDMDDPDFLEIAGITPETAEGTANALAAGAGSPVECPEHRARIQAERKRK